ncbi:MAG: hypoxanthine phosphoribosyltransferase [Clostridia bacterium]|nr:hypoxanthine phosphoribosyltransferase [Clostridia bacterium]
MNNNFKELISREELDKRIAELAEQIDNDYLGKEITIVCVMRGAVFFTVELTLKMKTKLKYEFITISSYEGTDTTGEITLRTDLRESIEGKDVLIVEDIIDTGRSMRYLIDHLRSKNPRTLKVCTLANKAERREIEVPIDYIGFEVPNKYIVGFGFDIDNNYRNMPYVATLEG